MSASKKQWTKLWTNVIFLFCVCASEQNSALSVQAADFSAIKELDSLSNEIMELQR